LLTSCLIAGAFVALENFSQDHVRHHCASVAVLAAPKAAFLDFVLRRLVVLIDFHDFLLMKSLPSGGGLCVCLRVFRRSLKYGFHFQLMLAIGLKGCPRTVGL